MEVTADGAWEITITPVADAPELSDPQESTGDAATWDVSHDGESNFSIVQAGDGLMEWNLLVNEIGAYEGSVPRHRRTGHCDRERRRPLDHRHLMTKFRSDRLRQAGSGHFEIFPRSAAPERSLLRRTTMSYQPHQSEPSPMPPTEPQAPPPEAPKTAPRRHTTSVLIVVSGAFAVLFFFIGFATGTELGGGDSDSASDSDLASDSPQSESPLVEAQEACAPGSPDVRIGDDGDTLTIDRAWAEESPGATQQDVLCIFDELEVPDSVVSRIESTRALDGTQEAEFGDFSAFWTFHPDDGLNMTITLES
ncbi:hypothetical protein [Glycomyces salinus]|uniref:hypothetical protein n=1 Tax=Glycomyces salinus TaxID=980294 RepID=UPI0018EB7040|nr:hypothetical protein [Glycomyces salinus]